MLVEKMMYLGVGFFIAGFLAVALGPFLWNRAVRLTRRRIEASSPVTMEEFIADKDTLRAQFAIQVQKMQSRIDVMQQSISQSASDYSQAQIRLAQLENERNANQNAIGMLKAREGQLVENIDLLEKAVAPLYDDKDALTQVVVNTPQHRDDIEHVLSAYYAEQARSSEILSRIHDIAERLNRHRKSVARDDAVSEIHQLLRDYNIEAEIDGGTSVGSLKEAEAQIHDAEARLNALLAETSTDVDAYSNVYPFNKDIEIEAGVKNAVAQFGQDIMAEFNSGNFDAKAMRERLEEIATNVTELVYAEDAQEAEVLEESLFDRVQKFAAESSEVELVDVSEDDGKKSVQAG